jgi:hypothetical protein
MPSIDGGKLRDVDDRWLLEPRAPGPAEDVTRRFGELEVGRERSDDDCIDSTAVEAVRLDYEDRAA